jgi:hypothetical protein
MDHLYLGAPGYDFDDGPRIPKDLNAKMNRDTTLLDSWAWNELQQSTICSCCCSHVLRSDVSWCRVTLKATRLLAD